MYCCIMHGRLMDQKILDGNTEVAPVATRVHVNGLKEGLRGLFPLVCPAIFFCLSFLHKRIVEFAS